MLDRDIKKFTELIEFNLQSILDRHYEGEMDTIPGCKLNFKGVHLHTRTGEPYYLFSTHVLEYSEELVHNPDYGYLDELEFIDVGEFKPVYIEIGVNDNFEVVKSDFG